MRIDIAAKYVFCILVKREGTRYSIINDMRQGLFLVDIEPYITKLSPNYSVDTGYDVIWFNH
jgi:hypothetical protein